MRPNQNANTDTDTDNIPTPKPDPDRTFDTVSQLAKSEPAFSNGGIRWLIFNENTNGLKESGAIIRLGGKVVIHRTRFFRWLDAQNGIESKGEVQ